jgi:hypothetical protein
MWRMFRLPAGLLAGLLGLACLACGARQALADEPNLPYPRSDVISGIQFFWFTHRRMATGSDNWPLTWSANDHQYTTWGDGGGFGGKESKGRVLLGIARVEGTAAVYRGQNVYGGYKPEVKAKPPGKSNGILAIGTDLYLWRCRTGNPRTYSPQQLLRSTTNGRSWLAASWQFPADLTFYCPTFVQFGKGYDGALDNYVYMYAAERNALDWEIQIPGRIMLMRAPRDQLMVREAYEFLTGRTEGGDPTWSPDVNARQPVIYDPNGVRLVSAAYNAGIGRYLVGYAHTQRSASNMALLDAPKPWGPWTTAAYEYGWGAGNFTGTCCLLWHFAPKWWSENGRRFTMAFSGGDQADSWNTVEGALTLTNEEPLPPPTRTKVPKEDDSPKDKKKKKKKDRN